MILSGVPGRTRTTQANWIRVGIAFPHRDARGFNIEIKALPLRRRRRTALFHVGGSN
jgi:hypothetical protein